MVTVATYQVTDIAVYPLGEFGSVVPELPARCIDDHEQTQFVAGIHKSRILRTVGVADHFHSDVLQLFGIAPVDAVRYGITHHGKVLMAVSADQRLVIRFTVQPETFFSFELDAPDTDTAAVTVDHIALFVTDADKQII